MYSVPRPLKRDGKTRVFSKKIKISGCCVLVNGLSRINEKQTHTNPSRHFVHTMIFLCAAIIGIETGYLFAITN
jgi:hypothetical protein